MAISRRLLMLLASVLLFAADSRANGQTIAGEDFDGGSTNGGFTATSSNTYEGDFEVGTEFVDWEEHDNTCNGLFDFCAGNRFDRFGIINATVQDDQGFEGLPFDMVDESLGSFPPDRLGILPEDVDNNAFGLADTRNGNNITDSSTTVAPGTVSAFWTFDISSGMDMQISIDMAAIGDFDNVDDEFETDDFMLFTYSIDGGPEQTAFDVRPEEGPMGEDTGILYTVTMDNGTEYDRYFSPFFNDTTWDTLIDSGPSGSLDYHPEDEDQDGFVVQEGAFGTEMVRAYSSGTFNDTELEVFKDPLFVNGDATGVQLDDDFTTVTAPIVGTGSELRLKLIAVADGSLEYTVFDNIVIEEVSEVTENADFNEDGEVDGEDFLIWQRGHGTGTMLSQGDANDDGDVDDVDLAIWRGQYGTQASGLTSVPEPNSLGLLAIALGILSRARPRD